MKEKGSSSIIEYAMNFLCVRCKEKGEYVILTAGEDFFFCNHCREKYPVEQGIVRFISAASAEGELYKYYNENYEADNPEWHRRDADWKYGHMKAMVAGIPHLKRIVDIGIGAGAIIKEMAKDADADELAGADLSLPILKRTKTLDPDIHLVQAESSNLPFESKRFDLALLIDVLEHAPLPLKTLREARRIADYVFIKIPLEVSLKNSIKKRFFKVDWKEEFGHLHKFSRKSFNELIDEAGLFPVAAKAIKAPLSLYDNLSLLKSALILLFNGVDGLFNLKRYQLNESNLFMLCRSEERLD